MNQQTKKIGIGILATTLMALGGIQVRNMGPVEICFESKQCIRFSRTDYNEERSRLIEKRRAGQSFSMAEARLLIAIYNYEISASGGVTVNDIGASGKAKTEVLEKIENRILGLPTAP